MLHASTGTFLLPPRNQHLQRVPLPLALQFARFSFPYFSQTGLGGVGSCGPFSVSTWPLVREQGLRAHNWQFRICSDRVMLRVTWKLILSGNSAWPAVPPWTKCEFIYKGQSVVAIQVTKEKQPTSVEVLVPGAFPAAVSHDSSWPNVTRWNEGPNRG